MNIIESIDGIRTQANENGSRDIFITLEDELIKSLHMFWEKAGKVLDGSGVKLLDPPTGYYALENNFFSALFLYSYYRADIESEKRILYSAMNQCLRGMVTGCDNLLDDEYKSTLETSLPQNGTRFRSVLDIMVSDRVFFDLCLSFFKDEKSILSLTDMSLKALIESGYQEASEEGGINEMLPPDSVLEVIHHYKTGILFNCPWVVPSIIEDIDEEIKTGINRALYYIGMGCQVMDDMADLERDIKTKHHNYVASLIYHESGREAWEDLKSFVLSDENSMSSERILENFSNVKDKAVKKAREYLKDGLNELFEKKHIFLVEPAIKFLSIRIGVSEFF